MSVASERKALLHDHPMDEDTAAMFCGRARVEIRLATKAGTIKPCTWKGDQPLYDAVDLARYVMGGAPTELEALRKARELEAELPRWWPTRETVEVVEGRVYVMETTEGPHRVKIGFSIDPERRLGDLAGASPVAVRLRLSTPGTMIEERALHRRFADWRIRGEWFDGSALAEIEKAVAEING